VTADEVRELFSEAIEDALEPEQRAAFEAALEGDPALAQEYREFRETVELTRGLADLSAPSIDVLPAVQRKLRQRSRGRFYRDRYAERRGAAGVHPLLLGALMLLVMGIAWIAFQLYTTAASPSSTRQEPTAQPVDP